MPCAGRNSLPINFNDIKVESGLFAAVSLNYLYSSNPLLLCLICCLPPLRGLYSIETSTAGRIIQNATHHTGLQTESRGHRKLQQTTSCLPDTDTGLLSAVKMGKNSWVEKEVVCGQWGKLCDNQKDFVI